MAVRIYADRPYVWTAGALLLPESPGLVYCNGVKVLEVEDIEQARSVAGILTVFGAKPVSVEPLQENPDYTPPPHTPPPQEPEKNR